MVHAHKPTPLALSDCEKYLRKIADRNAITYYLHSLKETYEQMEKRLKTIIESVKSTWSDDTYMINKGRAMLEEVDKVQNVRREKMQTGELHPVEVIEMIILDARVQAAEAKAAENGMVGNRQHLFKEVNFGDLEKYIKAFNTRKGTALTLPGVLFEGFGSVADLTSFLLMVKRNDFKTQNAEAVLDTLNVLFAGWPRDSKTINEDTAVTLEIPRQAKGIRQKTELLIGYISALVISNRITQHDMATLLVDIFGVQRASSLIDSVEKVDPNFKDYRLKMELDEIKKERCRTSKIVPVIPQVDTTTTSIGEAKNPMRKRLKKSIAANPFVSVKKSHAANPSPLVAPVAANPLPSVEQSYAASPSPLVAPVAANPLPSVEKSRAANPSPSVAPVPVLRDFFIR